MNTRVCVIDGQGGGIGSAIIKALRTKYGTLPEVVALGTNAMATSQMMRAGANRGASGENAIVRTVSHAQLILGPISITWANAMLGEVTPAIAIAVTSAPARKILLPLSQENIVVVGAGKEPLPHLVEIIVEQEMKEVLSHV